MFYQPPTIEVIKVDVYIVTDGEQCYTYRTEKTARDALRKLGNGAKLLTSENGLVLYRKDFSFTS